jgi:hypothetical protein
MIPGIIRYELNPGTIKQISHKVDLILLSANRTQRDELISQCAQKVKEGNFQSSFV